MMKQYILPILWMVVIFGLSSIPGSRIPPLFPGFDILAHLIEYSILGFLWARALQGKFFLAILLGILYGIFDEIHQVFVPLREFSIIDMLVDGAGVILGVVWHLLLKR